MRIIFILLIQITACTNTPSIKKEGTDKFQYIWTGKCSDSEILINSDKNGKSEIYVSNSNYSERYYGSHHYDYHTETLKIDINSKLSFGICKSYHWGEPYFDIGGSFNFNENSIFKSLIFHLSNDGLNIDTTFNIQDSNSRILLPKNKNEKGYVQLIISNNENKNIIARDTFYFNYYRSMICFFDEIVEKSEQKSLSFKPSEGSLLFNDKTYEKAVAN
jgi:hypothetical protein